MQSERWSSVRGIVTNILHGFSICKEARQRLLQYQLAEPKSYALVKPNDTRWNSHLYAAQRLLKLRVFIDMIFKQTEEFWSELQQ
jgi:hypothetical protein